MFYLDLDFAAMHASRSPDRCQPASSYLASTRLAHFTFGTSLSWSGHDNAAQQFVDYALKVAGGTLFQLLIYCVCVCTKQPAVYP